MEKLFTHNKKANPVTKKHELENEDHYDVGIHDDIVYGFVSDGAGGAGIFSKEWSRYLIYSLPYKSFKDDNSFKRWFRITSMLFEKNQRFVMNSDDQFVNQKFYNEGSFATLACLWANKKTKEVDLFAIGDSTIFIFEENDKKELSIKLIHAIELMKDIDAAPFLTNWRHDLPEYLPLKTHIKNKAHIFIASDSISKWIILNLLSISENEVRQIIPNICNSIYNNELYTQRINLFKTYNNNLNSFVNFVIELNKTKDKFNEFCLDKLSQNLLDADDFSLLTISI